jgi:hypothetical protein
MKSPGIASLGLIAKNRPLTPRQCKGYRKTLQILAVLELFFKLFSFKNALTIKRNNKNSKIPF